jgi:flavin-dependent dehydrogenase
VIDLVVVGGGPVGLMTAVHARLAGLEVVVLEQRASAPDKACGEGLMPDALRRLHAVGVDPEGAALAGIRYVDGRRDAHARFAAGPGRGVRRTTLVGALEERARDLGAQLVTGTIGSLTQGATQVVVSGIQARYAVAADGLHSSVRTQLGLQRPARGPRRYGVRQHFRAEPWSDLVEVHWTRDAEVYVTPVAHDLVGVAALGTRPLSFDAAMSATPAVGERLAGAVAVSRALGAGPLLQRTSARVSGRVLLVGDAAGYVDALTGEGLRLGFAGAEAVVAAVLADDPSTYEREWLRLTRSYRLLTHGLLVAATRPRLRRGIVPAAAGWPWAFGRVVDALAG